MTFCYILRPRERPDSGVQADGTFVKEMIIAKRTVGDGRCGTSPSRRIPAEVHLSCDGSNEKVYIMLRDTSKS